MLFVLLALLLLALLGPGLWAKSVLRAHSTERADFPGSAGELARHLLDRFDLGDVTVEETDRGDHYDPKDRAVRLSRETVAARSLSAVAAAAHEVGHAIQHRDAYGPFRSRQTLARAERFLAVAAQAGVILGMVSSIATRAPGLALAGAALILVAAVVSFLLRIANLPVEYDASFAKALPILEKGGYLAPEDVPAARRVLTACALTYVSSALWSMLRLILMRR